MKRSYLFGLGSFFAVAAIAGLLSLLIAKNVLLGLTITIVSVPLSLLTIRAAKSAPMQYSRLRAIAGWLLGFFTVDAIIFAAIGLAVLIPYLAK